MNSLYDISIDAFSYLTKIGREQEPVIQVDSFMKNANLVRQYAIDRPLFEKSKTFYPGISMPISSEYTMALIGGLTPNIKAALGLTACRVKGAISTYSIICDAPQSLSLGQRLPHFDTLSEKNMAFVHFLCDQENTGTSFYMQKSTNYQYVNESRSAEYYTALQNEVSSQQQAPQGYIHSSNNIFEKIHTASAAFNRIIGYRGCCLHSGKIEPDFVLSQDPAMGRLTVTTFIELY